jgi:hypothetical protein
MTISPLSSSIYSTLIKDFLGPSQILTSEKTICAVLSQIQSQHLSFRSKPRIDHERIRIQEKKSALWDCTERTLDPISKGFLYHFVLRSKYQSFVAFEMKQTEIFPAIELSAETVHLQFNQTAIEVHLKAKEQSLKNLETKSIQTRINNDKPGFYVGFQFQVALDRLEREKRVVVSEIKKLNQALIAVSFLNQIGYKTEEISGKIVLTLPDYEFLMFHYNRIRKEQKNLNLPKITLVSSNGRASDLEYVFALMRHDGLLSNSNEFLHDHLQHIYILMKKAYLTGSRYREIRGQDLKIAKKILEKVFRAKFELQKDGSTVFSQFERELLQGNIRLIETLLGALIDTLSTKDFTEEDIEIFTFSDILSSFEWQAYLFKRYGNTFNRSKLEQALLLLEKF